MPKLSITNGRVLSPTNQLDQTADIFIVDGKIRGIGTKPDGFVAEQTIDASNLTVISGLVDLSVSCREPGYEYKGTILSETTAATRGGITSLCMPPNTDPIADSAAIIDYICDKATFAPVNLFPIGALTKNLDGEQLSEMAALKEAGAIALSNAGLAVQNTQVLRNAFNYAASHDLTIFYHPVDAYLQSNGIVHEGLNSARFGLPGIPTAAETIALATALQLQKETGVRCHFCRLSAADSVELLRQAKAQGQKVSADVAIHQLLLTDNDVAGFNAYCHVQPPLRTLHDQQALIAGINEGLIQAICSDHQPHESTAKIAPFMATEPGISGVETLLPLALHLVENQSLSLETAINCLTYHPAQIIGEALGEIKIGADADLCVFDAQAFWQLEKNNMLSQGLNTPFNDWPLTGQVRHTIYQGEEVYSHAT